MPPRKKAAAKVLPNTTLIPTHLWDEYVAVRREFEAWERHLKSRRAAIEQLMGDNEKGVLDDGTLVIDFVHGKRSAFDQSAFKADHPEMLDLYKEVTETRTFNVPGYIKDDGE